MHTARIRRANPDDATALTACFNAAYANLAARIPDLPDVAAGLSDDIAQHCVLVADLDGRVLGGLVLMLAGEHAKLANVAVHPDARGSGIGGLLMDAAVVTARQQGLSEMRLTTHVAIPENVALYQHLGWQETGREASRVFMTKNI